MTSVGSRPMRRARTPASAALAAVAIAATHGAALSFRPPTFSPPPRRRVFCGHAGVRASKPSLFASPSSSEEGGWKSRAQPSFHEFAGRIVGPWDVHDFGGESAAATTTATATTLEVEEVMRSCGGAVQGVRELPLSILAADADSDEDEARPYHNRADGGFVYADDGSYSSGPERIPSEGGPVRVMSSLAFSGDRRAWTSTSYELPPRSDRPASAGGSESSGRDFCPSVVANLARPPLAKVAPRSDDDDDDDDGSECHMPPSKIDWTDVARCQMPSPNQPWVLPRARWERHERGRTNDDHNEEEANDDFSGGGDDGIVRGSIRGWSSVTMSSSRSSGESGESPFFCGAVPGGIADGEGWYCVNVLAVCALTNEARSIVRCYDGREGSLASVAFLEGHVVERGEVE